MKYNKGHEMEEGQRERKFEYGSTKGEMMPKKKASKKMAKKMPKPAKKTTKPKKK